MTAIDRSGKEFFITANSFAAPFFSDSSYKYVKARDAKSALRKFVKEYSHPCGLYAANCYSSADSKNKGESALARWVCNVVLIQEKLTKGKSGYSMLHDQDEKGHFLEVDGVRKYIKNPKGGRII